MAKLLFSHSYFYQYDNKQWKNQMPYPPLATITAAAWMREKGHEVDLFDTNLLPNPNGLESKLDSKKPDFFVLYDDGFNYLTKMCLTNMREAAFAMAKAAKARGCIVLASSSDSTDHHEQYLQEGVDIVMLGEAEQTLLELVSCGSDLKAMSEVHGIASLEEGKVVKSPPRAVMRDLDQLPIAAWDLIDIPAYSAIWKASQGYFSLNIATTRGCPFKCNWCAKPIYGNRYNTRTPEHVVQEIELLVNTYGAEHFWMCDDIFGLKPGWAQEFRTLLKAKGLNIRYKIQSRVDLLLKEDTIDALAESGLEEVWVGAESGSQKVLDAMDKGTDVEQIYEATRILKKKKVRIAFFLQFGYLGESREDIDLTLNMLTTLLPDDIGVSVSYPLPGTGFYERVKQDLDAKANWTDSDDLDMMFRGTYSPAYYKKLHRYVHKLYRWKQGADRFVQIMRNPFKAGIGQWRSVLAIPYYRIGVFFDGIQLKKLETASAE